MNDNRISISELGKRISYFRKKKLLTQKELGERLDISDKTISKWEKGTVAPDITVLENLTKVLDITFEDLLALENEYVKIRKKRKFNFYIIFLLLIIGLSVGIYTYCYEKKSNEWIAHELHSLNEQYFVEGYLLNKGETTKLMLSKLEYKIDEFDIFYIEIEICLGEEVVFVSNLEDKTYDFNKSLSILKDKINMNMDYINNNDIYQKEFYIKLTYKKKNSSRIDAKINLVLS